MHNHPAYLDPSSITYQEIGAKVTHFADHLINCQSTHFMHFLLLTDQHVYQSLGGHGERCRSSPLSHPEICIDIQIYSFYLAKKQIVHLTILTITG